MIEISVENVCGFDPKYRFVCTDLDSNHYAIWNHICTVSLTNWIAGDAITDDNPFDSVCIHQLLGMLCVSVGTLSINIEWMELVAKQHALNGPPIFNRFKWILMQNASTLKFRPLFILANWITDNDVVFIPRTAESDTSTWSTLKI